MNNRESSESSDNGNDCDPNWLLRSLLDAEQDGICFKDRKSRFTKISAEHAKKKFCLDNPEAIIGKTDFDFFDEKHARKGYDDEQRILSTGEPLKNVEVMETWPDGTVTWCSTTKVPIYDDGGSIVGIVGIARDITERKLQERHLQQVTRLYSAMSQMYQTILRSRTRDELFNGICQSLVESAHFDMAWIGLMVLGSQKVDPVAKFGDKYDYLQQIQPSEDNSPVGSGLIRSAIREGSTQVVNAFQEKPCGEPWQAEAHKNGWNSCASVPIRISENLTGALSVYSKVPGYFSEKEIILLERASADVSSVLELIDALPVRTTS